MLHFAYGSNMSRAPMRRRCPGAQPLGTALLRDHRFIVMANGYASVVIAKGQSVHGVLWQVTPRDLVALDAYEDIAGGLYRRAMLAVICAGTTRQALVYLGCESREGQPRAGYMEGVIAAAQEWNLPEDHIAVLVRCRRGGWTPAPDRGDVR